MKKTITTLKLKMIVLAAAVIGVGSFLPAPPAQAYTAVGVCGSGFEVIHSHALGTRGKVYLLWNDRTGENCVATMDVQQKSDKHYMYAQLTVKNTITLTDGGEYQYFAGGAKETKAYARGKCVYYSGEFAGYNWTSDYGWCGG